MAMHEILIQGTRDSLAGKVSLRFSAKRRGEEVSNLVGDGMGPTLRWVAERRGTMLLPWLGDGIGVGYACRGLLQLASIENTDGVRLSGTGRRNDIIPQVLGEKSV